MTKPRTLADFEHVVLADFEFVAKPGERPDVVCLAWHILGAGRTHCVWRDQLGSEPPYPVGDETLFVCFVGNAELGCHLSLNWPLPAHVLDLNPEFRCITNGCTVPEGRGLVGALAYFGLQHSFDSKLKADLQKRIGQGWPFTLEERELTLRYGTSDVDAMVDLLPKILPHIDLGVALYRGEFVKGLALMEHHGVPFDMEVFPELTNEHAWRYVRDAMVPAIDAAFGVYVKGNDGDWHFNVELFERYLDRNGIAWPRTEKGKLSLQRKPSRTCRKATRS